MAKFVFKTAIAEPSVVDDYFAEKARKEAEAELDLIRPTAAFNNIEIVEGDTYDSVLARIRKHSTEEKRLQGLAKMSAVLKDDALNQYRYVLTGAELKKALAKLVKGVGIKDLANGSSCPHYNLWSGTVLKNCIPVSNVDANSLARGYDKFGHPLTPKEIAAITRKLVSFKRDQVWNFVCEDWKYLSKFADWCDNNKICGYELIIADPDKTEYSPSNCLFVSRSDRLKRDWLVKFGECKAHSLGQIISDPLREVMRVWLENQK